MKGTRAACIPRMYHQPRQPALNSDPTSAHCSCALHCNTLRYPCHNSCSYQAPRPGQASMSVPNSDSVSTSVWLFSQVPVRLLAVICTYYRCVNVWSLVAFLNRAALGAVWTLNAADTTACVGLVAPIHSSGLLNAASPIPTQQRHSWRRGDGSDAAVTLLAQRRPL